MSSTRRTLLVGLAPAVLATGCHALPAALPKHADAAIPAGPHLDAELLALGRAYVDAVGRSHRAYEAMCAAEDRGDALGYSDHPEALIATNYDMFDGFPRPAMQHDIRGRTWTAEQIEAIRSAPPKKGYYLGGGLPEGWRINENAERRKAEILAAYDGWSAQMKAIEDATGQTQARADLDRRKAEVDALAERIIFMPAATVEGLLVKAEVYINRWGKPTDLDLGSPEHRIVRSVFADLMAMGGTT